MLRRPRKSPDPAIRSALTRLYWMTAHEVADRAKLPVSTVTSRLRVMHAAGELDKQPGPVATQYRLTQRSRT